ncbi:MAG: FtsX-like permease family protein [Patescibacteria group bacterium]|jgi:putative ABC transport system permease protein
MSVLNRGIKNAFRNNIRTASITLILGIAIALSLIMLLSLKTVQARIENVKSSIGNTIAVTPAGIRGFEGGGELLSKTDVENLASIPNIKKISQTLSDRLESQNTNLKSAIEAGTFGRRIQQEANDLPELPREITMPIMVTGTNDLTSTSSLNVSKLDITSGSVFDVNTDQNIALIGTDLATKNNLKVDSTFKAYNKDIKVVGIFDGGNTFANATLFMPLKALQNLTSQTDQISNLIVQTDSIESVASVETALKSKLGDKVDIVSQQDSSVQAIEPLQNIKTISTYSLIGALIAGSVIIFLAMLMIVRERRREIGVLKAIGSSNIKIVSQFTVEAMVLTLMSSVIGVILGFIFSNPVLNMLVTNSQSNPTSVSASGRGFGGAVMRIGGGVMPGIQNTLRDIHAVVGYDIILYGLLAAILIAIIGSAIPAFFIAKIRPAEVMRSE